MIWYCVEFYLVILFSLVLKNGINIRRYIRHSRRNAGVANSPLLPTRPALPYICSLVQIIFIRVGVPWMTLLIQPNLLCSITSELLSLSFTLIGAIWNLTLTLVTLGDALLNIGFDTRPFLMITLAKFQLDRSNLKFELGFVDL